MAAPERFAEKSDLLLQRGHRPYMGRSCHGIPRVRQSAFGGRAAVTQTPHESQFGQADSSRITDRLLQQNRPGATVYCEISVQRSKGSVRVSQLIMLDQLAASRRLLVITVHSALYLSSIAITQTLRPMPQRTSGTSGFNVMDRMIAIPIRRTARPQPIQ